jgi:hypothetical protein
MVVFRHDQFLDKMLASVFVQVRNVVDAIGDALWETQVLDITIPLATTLIAFHLEED